MKLRTRWSTAIAFLLASLPAAADGLGGLAGAGILFLILLFPPAVLGIVLAFALRALHKPRAASIIGGINVGVCAIVLVFARNVQGRSLLDAFNPWWTFDDAVVVTICLVLVTGNLLFLLRAFRHRLIVVAGVFLFVALQFVGTAGRSTYYDHDPLKGDVASVRLLDAHHAESNERVFRHDTDLPCCTVYERTVIDRQPDGSWRITWARPNEDPRVVPRRQARQKSSWAFRFPFQPSHVAEILIDNAERLDENWGATDTILLDAVRVGAPSDWIERLVARGASPNAVDEHGDTPLMIAVSRSDGRDRAGALVQSGADPNLRLEGGNSHLHRAVQELTHFSGRATQWLLELGADPTLTNDRGETALRVARRSLSRAGSYSSEQRIGNRAVEMLLSATEQRQRNLATVHEFATRKNEGNVGATLALFVDEPELHFGPLGTITGRAALRGILEYDVALNAHLEFDGCAATWTSVACRVVETNDWLRTADIESITYDENVFTFAPDGRIESVAATLSAESVQVMGTAMGEFGAWAEANKPAEYAELFSAEGAFVYSGENARKVLALLRTWREGYSNRAE